MSAVPRNPTGPVIANRHRFETVQQPRLRGKPLRPVRSGTWLISFVLIQIACQLVLLSGSGGAWRQVIRSMVFGTSLLWLAMLWRRGPQHPAAKAALVVVAMVAAEFFHPNTNGLVSGLVQVVLYIAILAPLLWIPTLSFDIGMLRRLILILWSFNALSSATGVLQVYFPGRFQPSLSTAIASHGSTYVHGLEIQTANGERMFRPMGLTDSPGGAAVAGIYAGLFGLGFLISERRGLLRWLGVGGATLGLMCLYLSQVRLFIVMFALCVLTLCAILIARRDMKRLSLILAVIPAIVAVSFIGALALGGHNMVSRIETLVKGRPGEIYYKSRGFYLENTVQELLPKYPLGAGLGRWGMVYSYFGKKTNSNNDRIWVEIQWTGWLLDGGLPLILAYVTVIAITLWTSLRIARLRAAGPIWIWAVVLLAYDVGVLANTFGSSPFIGQEGLEFWMLNAALYVAARTEIAKRRALMPEEAPPNRNRMMRIRPA